MHPGKRLGEGVRDCPRDQQHTGGARRIDESQLLAEPESLDCLACPGARHGEDWHCGPRRQVEQRLAFLKFADLHFISAARRQGLGPVWTSIGQAYRSAMIKMTTPVLTRLVHEAVQFQSPKRSGMFRPKLRYAHQGGMNPPVIVVHGNSLEHVTDAYKRFLEGRFRKEFNLVGTPLRIEMRTSKNPFADKE